MEGLDALDNSEKTIAILGDRWWPQAARLEGDKTCGKKKNVFSTWERRDERPNVGGVSIRSRNVARSRKGCVVNGPMTKAYNE